ncbi:hypothetical protein DPMN_164194 [Dreissena polymorpha]|uniref:Uncharacterized protein n=1 Tax=Dreissena polymorpha TaxID=45954 RepID=A0A9D4IVW2_DREPO|nr:hypothetical protein DPMN_164194 [Dreissena polymorpha]
MRRASGSTLRMGHVTAVRTAPSSGARRSTSAEPIHGYLAREDAVLIEVEGNQGNDEFIRRYNSLYIVLETLEQYAKMLRNKFQNNSRVTVINLGLGAKNVVLFVKIECNNACATSKFSGEGGETPLYSQQRHRVHDEAVRRRVRG